MDNCLQRFSKFKKYYFNELIEIKSPADFFNKIRCSLKTVQHATIFTMYTGDCNLTKKILKLISEREKTNKKTRIVLDKNRGQTKNLVNFIKENNLNCFKFVNLSTFINILRIREILAVFHSKLYIFDDEIILTGANLDGSYFTNRLDRYFIIKNKVLINDLYRKQYSKNTNKDTNSDYNVLFKYGRKNEKYVISEILQQNFDSIYISSAYFNLPTDYLNLFKSYKNIHFFVNAPDSNIFTNFSIFGFLITSIYTYSSYYATKYLPKALLYEFNVKGYTMHKKGLWAFKDNFCVSIIGSSNFNRRSTERDEELNFCVITQDSKTVRIFKEEILFLMKHSKLKTVNEFKFGKFKFIAAILFFIFNKFL